MDVWFKDPLPVAVLSMLVAQMIKVPIHFFLHKQIDFKLAVSTGGMPSSHSAMVTSLAFSIGLRDGFTGDLFAVASIFALIVMYDAMGIRRHAGRQAVTLNRLLNEKLIGQPSYDKSTALKQQLKEMLGHEPKEVIWGAITGIIVALVVGLI